jgi:hypothetical protein
VNARGICYSIKADPSAQGLASPVGYSTDGGTEVVERRGAAHIRLAVWDAYLLSRSAAPTMPPSVAP